MNSSVTLESRRLLASKGQVKLAQISERCEQVDFPPLISCFTTARHSSLVSHPQIEKDLLRTMPTNACFCSMSSVGVPRLRRVLRALAWLYPDIGYCQGTGMVRKVCVGVY